MTSEDYDSNGSDQTTSSNNGGIYEIKIKGLIDDHWQQWFEGMTLTRVKGRERSMDFTLIRGPIQDQPALHGLLAKIRDLNMTLLSIHRINSTLSKRKVTGPGQTPKLLLGVCGLYCGACYHYRASFPESKHLLEEASQQGRKLEGFICAGCRSDVLYIHPGCAECEIRACAQGKDILHCGLCSEFPCDQIKTFHSDGRLHHLDIVLNLEELRAKGPDRWLVEQEQRWRCTCGARFSWYEKTCHNCGAILKSYT